MSFFLEMKGPNSPRVDRSGPRLLANKLSGVEHVEPCGTWDSVTAWQVPSRFCQEDPGESQLLPSLGQTPGKGQLEPFGIHKGSHSVHEKSLCSDFAVLCRPLASEAACLVSLSSSLRLLAPNCEALALYSNPVLTKQADQESKNVLCYRGAFSRLVCLSPA